MQQKYGGIDVASALHAIDMEHADWRRPKKYLELRSDIISFYETKKKFSKLASNSNEKKLYLDTRQQLLKKQKERVSKYHTEVTSSTTSEKDELTGMDDTELDGTESRPSFETRIVQKKDVEEIYAFVGMHHIMEVKDLVKIKFGVNDPEMFAYATSDGTITVMNMSKKEIISILKSPKGVTDFDWYFNNDYIISTHQDKMIRLWSVGKQKCTKSLEDKVLPTNVIWSTLDRHYVFVGFTNGIIYVLNISTAKIIQKFDVNDDLLSTLSVGTIKTRDQVGITCLCVSTKGEYVFIGDSKGGVTICYFDKKSFTLTKRSRNQITKNKNPIQSIDYSICTINDISNQSCLVVTGKEDFVKLYILQLDTGKMSLHAQYSIGNSVLNVKTQFCPFVSNRNSPCFVSGNENTQVCIFDMSKKEKDKQVNRLFGHAFPVVDVCWNSGETLLASADSKGTIIIWKKASFDTNPKGPRVNALMKVDFMEILNELAKKTDDEKLNIISRKLEEKRVYINSDQLIQFVNYLDFATSKIELIKSLKSKTYGLDKKTIPVVLNAIKCNEKDKIIIAEILK